MREVRIHDTLTGAPRLLEPRDPSKVGIYACGPTVYGPIHVGNARPYVIFALLKRFLEHEGNEVTLVENVTDVNDKIYDAARERGVPSAELARDMTEAYVAATDVLGIGRPDYEPKASESIDDIIALIAALIESGHAYEVRGDVYFRVGSFHGYGKLSNRPLEEMQQGEGDDAAELKEAPQDFALWKRRKEGEDTWWDAPWGQGRPGWHIECSAMAEALLGLDFEVHGGGSDLVFPHHENEIAQTEAARGTPLARVWMHNGMVEMDAEKMAKSEGNIRLLQVALDEFGPEALVMWLVGAHYRKPVAFSEEAVADEGRTPRVIVYGRNPVREALRGKRRVQRVFATERAAHEVWLGEVEARIVDAREIQERCGSPDHQGICAEVEAYPYADPDALLDEDDALVLCLDEVQDPHNLGAVCRVAEVGGCAGVVLPERRTCAAAPGRGSTGE